MANPARARKEGHLRRFTVITGQLPARLSCAAAGPPDAATTFGNRESGCRACQAAAHQWRGRGGGGRRWRAVAAAGLVAGLAVAGLLVHPGPVGLPAPGGVSLP